MQSSTQHSNRWQEARILILAEPEQASLTAELASRLRIEGATTVLVRPLNAAPDGLLGGEYTHGIAILPSTLLCAAEESQTKVELGDVSSVIRMVGQLSSLVCLAAADNCRHWTWVQFGGGRFGTGIESREPCFFSAAAFARSLHLERPSLKLRLIDLAPDMPQAELAELILREATGQEIFETIGFDRRGQLLIPQVRPCQPHLYPARKHSWTDEDVILVTGGAKGITAACALGLARRIGGRYALVGRSSSVSEQGLENQEIAATLQAFSAIGVPCRYYQADLADAVQVRQLLATVCQELGPITAVIHGAGVNRARRVETVNPADALDELGPKLLGAIHLCRELAATPPKMLLALTSIIGVTGMPGNAWYAFSNEGVDLLLRRFTQRHPQTTTQAVAFSVWGEIGMGLRGDSVRKLSRMGIEAIPTEAGVERFVRLFTHDPGHGQVVVTARLAGLDTWPTRTLTSNADLRFIDRIMHCQPGVELVVRTRLTLARDPYLVDHNFRGSLLFPTVFGLEAMAQAAAVVTGQASPWFSRIEEVSLRRPIVVDPKQGTEIEIYAIAHEANAAGEITIRAAIRTEQTGFAADHFSAVYTLGKPCPGPATGQIFDRPALGIDPLRDIYGRFLFQGDRFQRMGAIQELDRDHAVFTSESRKPEVVSRSAFGESGFSLLLGDPFLRDILLQAGQLTIPQETCLPVQIQQIERFGNTANEPGKRVVVAPYKVREQNEYVAEVYVTDEAGQMLERLTGYRLRILDEDPARPTAEELVDPTSRDEHLLGMALAEALRQFEIKSPALAISYLPGLHQEHRAARHQREIPVIDRAVNRWFSETGQTPQPIEVAWTDAGKPYLNQLALNQPKLNQLDLSLSHDDGCCFVVVGEGPQGCDVQPLEKRSLTRWEGLFDIPCRELMAALVHGGEEVDRAGTRVWTMMESVRKASGETACEPQLVARHASAVLLEAKTNAGRFSVITFPWQPTRGPDRMFAIVVGYSPSSEPIVGDPMQATLADSQQAARPGMGAGFQKVHGGGDSPAISDCSTDGQVLVNEVSNADGEGTDHDTCTRSDGQTRSRAARLRELQARGVDPFCHSVNVAVDGPAGQPVQELRFVVSFQESSTISRHVSAAQYLKWMGRMRELVTSFNVPSLVKWISTGNWGLVTNYGAVQIHGELTANDVVQMRFWTDAPHGSEVEYYCDFWKLGRDGSCEQVAFAEQKATWVRLVGHGQVIPEPFPEELVKFMLRMAPATSGHARRPGMQVGQTPRQLDCVADLRTGLDRRGDSLANRDHAALLNRSLAHCHPGAIQFTAAARPTDAQRLWRAVFETTLEDSNLVGNIYYANYFTWQRRLLDQFLHAIEPNYFRGIGADGELISLTSRMDYLREAMPFDRIQVVMLLRELSEYGAEFQFDFHRVSTDGAPQKLSVGRQRVLWVKRDAQGKPIPTTWPSGVRAALLQKDRRFESDDLTEEPMLSMRRSTVEAR